MAIGCTEASNCDYFILSSSFQCCHHNKYHLLFLPHLILMCSIPIQYSLLGIFPSVKSDCDLTSLGSPGKSHRCFLTFKRRLTPTLYYKRPHRGTGSFLFRAYSGCMVLLDSRLFLHVYICTHSPEWLQKSGKCTCRVGRLSTSYSYTFL